MGEPTPPRLAGKLLSGLSGLANTGRSGSRKALDLLARPSTAQTIEIRAPAPTHGEDALPSSLPTGQKATGKARGNDGALDGLIDQILDKLPHRTGSSSQLLDADLIFRRHVELLVGLSGSCLEQTVARLADELEGLPRVSAIGSEQASPDLLRSRMVILKVKALCLAKHWSSRSGHLDPTSPSPLSNALAQQMLSIVSQTLKQVSELQDHIGTPNTTPATQRSPKLLHAYTTASLAPTSTQVEPFRLDERTQQGVLDGILQSAQMLLHYLSASNWPVVFAKLRSRLAHHAANEDSSDTADATMLELCCLSRGRTADVLQEMLSMLPRLKKHAAASYSIALASVIWSCIETFPTEFRLYNSREAQLGVSSELFDACAALADNQKKRAYLWPLMIALLICCPAALSKLANGVVARTGSLAKKAAFLEAVRKSSKGGKPSDVSTRCLLDFCRAASLTTANEKSGLGLLGQEMDHEVRGKLLDTSRHLVDPAEESLAAEAIATLYRLDRSLAVQGIIPDCLALSASVAHELALIDACGALMAESARDPQSAPANKVQEAFGPPLRRLFLESLATQASDMSRNSSQASHPHSTRVSTDDRGGQELLPAILVAWQRFPSLVQSGLASSIPSRGGESRRSFSPSHSRQSSAGSDVLVNADSPEQIAAGLFACLHVGGSAELRFFSSQVLLGLLQLPRTPPGGFDIQPALLSQLPLLLSSLCAQTLDVWPDTEASRQLLTSLRTLLELLVPLWERLNTSIPRPQEWQASMRCLEIVTVLTVWSSHGDLLETTIDIARIACRLLALPFSGFIGSGTWFDLLRADLNGHFEVRVDAVREWLGRVAGQADASPVTLAIWEEAYRRWSPTSFTSGGLSDDHGSIVEHSESFSALLISLSAVYASSPPRQQLSPTVPFGLLANRFYESNRPIELAPRFLAEMVDTLTSEDTSARDEVAEYLPLAMFPSFCRYLRTLIASTNADGKPDAATILLASQVLSVATAVLLRTQGPLSQIPEDVAHVDVFLITLAQLAHRVSPGRQRLDLRAQLAVMLSDTLGSSSMTRVCVDAKTRSRLIEHLTVWVSEVNETGEPDLEQRSLELAALSTIGQLLKGLVIRDHDQPEDRPRSNVRMLNRLWTFLDGLLSKLSDAVSPVRDAPLLSPFDANATGLEAHHASVSGLVASAIVELVASNAELAGPELLERCLSSQPSARAVHLRALAQVMASGVNITGVPASRIDDLHQQLADLLCDPNLLLFGAIVENCSGTDAEDVAEVLLSLLDTKELAVPALVRVLERELDLTELESTLFRANTFATRLTTLFARSHAYSWLRSTLKDLLIELYQSSTLAPPEGITDSNLEGLTERFVSDVAGSWHTLPGPLLHLLSSVAALVSRRFPEFSLTAVASVLFLRLICPTIVTPSMIDLDLPDDTPQLRKGLIGVTKSLQTLCNSVKAGSRDNGRAPSPFVDRNVAQMTQLLEDIASGEGYTDSGLPACRLGADDWSVLTTFLLDHSDKIGTSLVKGLSKSRRRDELGDRAGQECWDRLSSILAKLAALRKDSDTSLEASQSWPRSPLRTAFDQDKWSKLFFEIGLGASGSTLVCLRVGKLLEHGEDLDSFGAYLVKYLKSAILPLEILADCSNFDIGSDVPLRWLRDLLSTSPGLDRIKTIYVFNPSSAFVRLARRTLRAHGVDRFDRPVVAISTLSELSSHTSRAVSALLPDLRNFLQEEPLRLNQLILIEGYKGHTPVILEVGSTLFGLTSVKKRDITPDLRISTRDTFALADIIDLQSDTSDDTDGDRLRIKLAGGQEVTLLDARSERDAFAILQAARARAMSRGQRPSLPQQPASLCVTSHQSASSIPNAHRQSAILNAALYSMIASSADVRSAGHELLSRAIQTFDLDRSLLSPAPSGLVLVSNSANLVIEISEKLASSAPALALDFLLDSFKLLCAGLTAQASLYATALRPWLQHLVATPLMQAVPHELYMEKAREIVRCLILLGRDEQIFVSLQTRLWPIFSRLDDLAPVLVDELCAAAITSQSLEDDAHVLSIAATASSIALCGHLISRLRQLVPILLDADTTKPTLWAEANVLLRLTASAPSQSNVAAQVFLTELLHLALLLAGQGKEEINEAVHRLLVSTTNALSLSLPADVDQAGLESCLARLEAIMSTNKMQTVGTLRHQQVDGLMKLLLDLLEAATLHPDQSNAWRSRWLSMACRLCFSSQGSLQARAFVALGHLCGDGVDDQLLFQLLNSLGNALLNDARDAAVAAVDCLAKVRNPHEHPSFSSVSSAQISQHLPSDSAYPSPLVSIAVGLLQTGVEELFLPALRLLSNVLQSATDSQGWHGLSSWAIGHDQHPAAASLNASSGVAFRRSLSFGLATLLVKGLSQDSTRQETIEALTMLIRLSLSSMPNGHLDSLPTHSEAAGYLAALLPFAYSSTSGLSVESLCAMVKLPVPSQGWLSLFDLRDEQSKILLIGLTVALLSQTSGEEQTTVLIGLLMELAQLCPDLVKAFRPYMSSSIDTALLSNNNALAKAAERILRLTLAASSSRDASALLNSIGFGGLLECASFTHEVERERVLCGLCVKLIGEVLAT